MALKVVLGVLLDVPEVVRVVLVVVLMSRCPFQMLLSARQLKSEAILDLRFGSCSKNCARNLILRSVALKFASVV